MSYHYWCHDGHWCSLHTFKHRYISPLCWCPRFPAIWALCPSVSSLLLRLKGRGCCTLLSSMRQIENPERTHSDTGRTSKLNPERCSPAALLLPYVCICLMFFIRNETMTTIGDADAVFHQMNWHQPKGQTPQVLVVTVCQRGGWHCGHCAQEAAMQAGKQVSSRCQEEQSCMAALKYHPLHFLLEGARNQLLH